MVAVMGEGDKFSLSATTKEDYWSSTRTRQMVNDKTAKKTNPL